MAGQLRHVVFLFALACTQAAAQVDANFQALLSALMQGTQVALLSPLPDGTLQVTSFAVPGQRSAADAAALIERARINLTNLGVAEPTGEQLALALVGGTIDVPSGRTQIVGVVPQGIPGATIRSQVVNTSGFPQVIGGTSPAGVNPGQAAGGGTAAAPNGGLAGLPPAQQTQITPAGTSMTVPGLLPVPPSTR